MNATFALNVSTPSMMNKRYALGQQFYRTVSSAKRRRLWGFLIKKPTSLYSLERESQRDGNLLPRVKDVNLDEIVGSEGRSQDFDNQFNPLKLQSKDRWVGIAIARLMNRPLPPIQLLQTPKGYFIRDGHHRVSVAKAFGQATIEAEIV